jgi:hypothetical protein
MQLIGGDLTFFKSNRALLLIKLEGFLVEMLLQELQDQIDYITIASSGERTRLW